MNTPFRRLVSFLRGSDSGQSLVEYLTLVGACALVGIAGFNHYGKAVNNDLRANAKHIEGEGLPTTEGILGSLGADYNEIPGWCVKPNYCFAAGTPVQTERGDRSIESIRVGDKVWARDVTTGAIALRSVLNTYRTASVPVIDLELSVAHLSSEHLRVTPSHLFWLEGPGWVRADSLGAQPLWSTEGSTEAWPQAARLDGEAELTTVYNLEVSEFHSYFVGHSHVLVHNGGPGSTGCPDPPALAIDRDPRTRSRDPIECGETGSYYGDLGGFDKEWQQPDHMKMARPSNNQGTNLVRDHIPSSQALNVRANQLLDDMAATARGRCKQPTADETAALDAAQAQAAERLGVEANYDGFVLVETVPLHLAGRTNGQKNKTPERTGKKRYEGDADDLAVAARKDIYEILKALRAGVVPDPECAKKIRAALLTIGGKTNAEYDSELGGLASQLLKLSGFDDIIQACEERERQPPSEGQ